VVREVTRERAAAQCDAAKAHARKAEQALQRAQERATKARARMAQAVETARWHGLDVSALD
jgi:hypothetical protein